MKMLAISIYDEKAECFGQPFFVPAIGIAARHFTDAVHNPESMMGKYPGDFTLYQIGYWNNNDSKFENLTAPKFIAKGTDYITDRGDLQAPLKEAK